MKQGSYPKELKDMLIHDFTILSNLVYSSEKVLVKHHMDKFKILEPAEVQLAFRQMNMIKVRNKRVVTQQKFRKRTNREIRDIIINELMKQPQCSLYQLEKASGLNYKSLRNWVKKHEGMLNIIKLGTATYVAIKDNYRMSYKQMGIYDG